MPNNPLNLMLRHDLTPAEINELENRIYDFNADRVGSYDAAQLGFVLTQDHQIVGAVAGFTWAGICEIRQMWIDERFRGQGHGQALMQKAIDEARIRECASIYLATYSFQAPGFYEKLGFCPAVVIPNKPLGHSDIVMCLSLHERVVDPPL